jgi:hypothetical protein
MLLRPRQKRKTAYLSKTLTVGVNKAQFLLARPEAEATSLDSLRGKRSHSLFQRSQNLLQWTLKVRLLRTSSRL